MNNTSIYTVWLSSKGIHTYFEETTFPVTLLPMPETSRFFRRNGLLFKKIKENYWTVLSSGKEIEPMEQIEFEIQPQSTLFHYVSVDDAIFSGVSCKLHTTQKPGIWRILSIPIRSGPKEIEWTIKAKEAYWECLVFLQKDTPDSEWIIRERRDYIRFTTMQKINWINHSPVFRSISTEKIPLKNRYSFQLQLKEKKNGRERILYESIPSPSPAELSVTGNPDTITTYIYL